VVAGILLSLSIGLVIAASLHDLGARTVPNWLSLALAGTGAAASIVGGHLVTSCLMAAVVLTAGSLCWRRGWLGGGDVKLLAAAALGMSPALVPSFVAAVAIAGGGLAVLYLALRRLVPRPAGARPRRVLARALRAERWRIRKGGPLPYACAIASGFLFVVL
jgi:prepilin peptidase CpaA